MGGEAKISGGYRLPAKYVISTVGPQGENPEKLEACYENSLNLLLKQGLRSIAFPCISTGIYGYPNDNAANIALRTTRIFLEKNHEKIDRVIFCLFLKVDVGIYDNRMSIMFPALDECELTVEKDESENKQEKENKTVAENDDSANVEEGNGDVKQEEGEENTENTPDIENKLAENGDSAKVKEGYNTEELAPDERESKEEIANK